MIEIPRTVSRFGATGIFRGVSGLNGNDKVAGYLEQYYFGGSPTQGQGIPIVDSDRLEYAELVAKCYGINMGHISPFGMVSEDKFFQLHSFLVNGTILTAGYRREYFGTEIGKAPRLTPGLKVSERYPERILKISAETVDRLRETAHMVNLPLEEFVPA